MKLVERGGGGERELYGGSVQGPGRGGATIYKNSANTEIPE